MNSKAYVVVTSKLDRTTSFLVTLACSLEKLIIASSCLFVVQSVRLSTCISSAPTGSILAKFGIGGIILKSDQKNQFGLKSDTLFEDLITFNCCRRHQCATTWLPSNVIRLLGWPKRLIYVTGTRQGFTLYIRCLYCSFLKFQASYLILRGSWQEYIARTFMICTQQILFEWTNQDWDGRGV